MRDLLASCLIGALVTLGTGSHMAVAQSTTSDDIGQDLEELESTDDGSRALKGHETSFDLEALRPVSADEEKALLGDWGDAENEDGD